MSEAKTRIEEATGAQPAAWTERPPVAVVDLGKTNAKLLVFTPDGRIAHQTQSKPEWLQQEELRVLDEPALWAWMIGAIGDALDRFAVERVIVTTHGCTFALIGGGALAAPILDYEQAPPPEIEEAFAAVSPPFAETFSPPLPVGFNLAKHLFWLGERDPDLLKRTQAIVCYPQYWTWRLSGEAVSEVSYLGCHTHLWSPVKDDFSSLVDARDWREKMPPLVRAGAEAGYHSLITPAGAEATLVVHNGVHDSNAALYFYRSVGYSDFTLVSTGTWVIVFNTDCPLGALDPARDMLANVSVDREPVSTARFMGGREFDLISEESRADVSLALIERVIAKGLFALPSFAPGGPFPGRAGATVGPEPSAEERRALALLYVACMTHHVLGLVRSRNTIIVDGGLARSRLYGGMLAALRPGQTILGAEHAEGTAAGAAALAYEAIGLRPFEDPCRPIEPVAIEGLDDYYRRWLDMTER
ncbi:FGGY-family carbohydrate kinase [Marinivivus vitaminiproducens]|uniref:FGGY-family carbohydrate kinase n=1 Tax=Marinivivus vitaminiproducens TaxID=3035935 RepID=UPI0027AA602C|nr:carbohydrate kinase [Geminicoccaceae bacterium SCSIO 64248]